MQAFSFFKKKNKRTHLTASPNSSSSSALTTNRKTYYMYEKVRRYHEKGSIDSNSSSSKLPVKDFHLNVIRSTVHVMLQVLLLHEGFEYDTVIEKVYETSKIKVIIVRWGTYFLIGSTHYQVSYLLHELPLCLSSNRIDKPTVGSAQTPQNSHLLVAQRVAPFQSQKQGTCTLKEKRLHF